MSSQLELHARAIADPEAFWGAAAAAVDWDRPFGRVLDASAAPLYRWFAGGELNTCFNALDRHVAGGRADQLALVHDSAVTGEVRRYTYRELRDAVARFAGVLRGLGVDRGDRVVIYMPMVPEAVIGMLACARLGAVHSVVFGGFAAKELASRIDDARPKVVLSASCGVEGARVVPYSPLLNAALELAEHRVAACVVLERPQAPSERVAGRDHDWEAACEHAAPVDCVPVAATDPLYVLYTSGTTGRPKGIVRDNGGHAVALAWSMRNVYGVRPGETFWAASDIGWVVGHSYIVYGPLLHGCTTVLFEGKPVGTPDAGAFWRVAADHGVTTMFTAPTAFRVIKQHDHAGEHLARYDLSRLRALFLAGERCDPDTLHWARERLGIPVVDHWWQTETGWPVTASCLGLDDVVAPAGSAGRAVPGWDLRVVDREGRELPRGEVGEIVVRLPLPPGSLPTLWGADDHFRERYLSRFPGHYQTDDAGFVDDDGWVSVMSRVDDIINVAGHRLSTGAMEEVLDEHPDVSEAAVIGVADPVKGQLPVGFLVLERGVERAPETIRSEVVAMVRERIGPVAAFKQAVVVERLPKTRSGKILRRTMRALADGAEFTVPPTIEDPAVLDEIRAALAELGLPRARAPVAG